MDRCVRREGGIQSCARMEEFEWMRMEEEFGYVRIGEFAV